MLVALSVPAAASTAHRIGSVPPRVAGSRVLGVLPASTAVRVTVTLKPRHPSALAGYANAVSTPGSSVYHRYLTVGQFAHRFGATAAQIAAVKASLAAHGLQSGAASANGLAIPLRASAGRLARAFAIGFDRVSVPGGRVAFANTSAPRFAGAVAGVVQGVIGLSSLEQRHPVGLAVPHGKAHAVPAVVTGGPQPCSAASSVGVRTADQIASAYRFSSLYGAGDQGSGQTVALYELEPNNTSDISAYQSCYGTSASVTYTQVDSGAGTGAGTGEAALDIEDVIGLAAKSNLIVYQGPNTNAGAYDTYNAIITQNTAKVISTSWGLCEPSAGASPAAAENILFQEAATQGQSILAAAGDSGSEDCGTNALAVDDPSSQPYVTGVGGTSLSALGPPPTQSVWNNGIGAGGGGNSTLWAMPNYQSGAPPSLKVINGSSTNSTCHAAPGSFCREVPDVSADADPNTGYAIDYKGRWIGIGGTSAAAPTWASFTALVDASSPCSGQPIGFANPVLYRAAGNGYSADFSDVTSGNNDFTGTGGGRFAAGIGFDLATGLGTPIGSTLPAALCSGGGTTATVTVTNPGNQTGTVGAPVTLAIKATASDGQALTYSASGLPAGLSISSASGLISGTPTTALSTAVTVTATDASGPHGTATFSWTISRTGVGGCAAAQLLSNSGFETGSASPWSSTGGVINSSAAGEPSHSGTYLAWLDGYGRTHTDTLAQTVSIPTGCSNYTFGFWLHIDTAEPTTNAHDTLSVQVLSGTGTVLATLASLSNRNAASGYAQYTYGLAAYAGQRVTLQFTGSENPSRQTSFVVDDTALNVS